MATEKSPVNYCSVYLPSPHVESGNYFQWEHSSTVNVLQYNAGIYGNSHQLHWSLQSPASLFLASEENGQCDLCLQQRAQFSYGGCSAACVNDNLQRYETISNPQSPVSTTSPLSHHPYDDFGSYSNLSSTVDYQSSSDCSYNSSPSISCCSSPLLTRSVPPPPASLQDSTPLCVNLEVAAQISKELSKPRNRQPRTDRLCFTSEQLKQLEASFEQKKYLSPREREQLSAVVGVTSSQIKTWYQNRRTKWKRCYKAQLAS